MGDSILEYIIVGSIFLMSAIQRREIFKILRQNKNTKPRSGNCVSASNKCINSSNLNRQFSSKSYVPVHIKFKIDRT